jgi:hypothetical protein
MWVESVEQVGDEAIALSVECLADEARERTAARIAWVTLHALRSETIEDLSAWHAQMEGVVGQHVSFSIAEDRLENATSAWRREAMGRAIVRFVHTNRLVPTINRHLEALAGADRIDQPES